MDKRLTQVWLRAEERACPSPPHRRDTFSCVSETLSCRPTNLIRALPSPRILTATVPSAGDLEKTKEGLGGDENARGRLLQEESKKEGAVALHVYRAYWRAVGRGLALAILLSLLLMQGRSEPPSPSSHRSPRSLSQPSPCTDRHKALSLPRHGQQLGREASRQF